MNPIAIRFIAVMIGALIAMATGWHIGAKIEREKWQEEKITIQDASQKALQDQVAKNELILKDQQEKSYRASQNYEKAIDDLRVKYSNAGGLRISRVVCDQSAGSAQAASASRFDEASAATIELSEPVESGLFAMTKRADELVEQLRALQQWIIENGFYPTKISE